MGRCLTKKSDFQKIKENLTFFDGKYIKKSSGIWHSVGYHLSEKLFMQNIYSDRIPETGFLNSFNTKFFAVDIDAHQNNPEIIPYAYKELVDSFAYPSFVVKSPRGVHVYYLLENHAQSSILCDSVKERLKSFRYAQNYEVRPYHNSGLRLPSARFLLDKDDISRFLLVKKGNFGSYLDAQVHHFAEEFLVDEKSMSGITRSYTERNTIMKGETNDALNQYIPLWRSQGLTIEQCVERFIAKLDPSYSGACTSPVHMLKRIRSFYRNVPVFTRISEKTEISDIENKYRDEIQKILSLYKNTKNMHNDSLRKKSIKDDALKVFWLYEINQSILDDPLSLSVHAYQNPFFKREMERGCIPVPSSMIRQNNILFFKEIGFLSLPFGKHYDIHKKSCIHYKVSLSLPENSPVYKKPDNPVFGLKVFPLYKVRKNQVEREKCCRGKTLVWFNGFPPLEGLIHSKLLWDSFWCHRVSQKENRRFATAGPLP